MRWVLLGYKGATPDYGSYIRQAYKDGLAMQDARGYNPYKFGVVSGSDSHSTAVPYRQKNFFGVHGTFDDTPEKRQNGGRLGLNNLWITPAGLSVVWAEENTREAIFAGMKRKETYSTSGVRIMVRLFGGWEFGPDVLKQKGAVALGDAELKQLIVGKTVNVTNTVTGQRFEILYGTSGHRLVTAVDGKPADMREMAELAHAGDIQYEIKDGHLTTELAGTQFAVTVYKVGDKYVAARSNEFGYANYEVEEVK